MIWRLVKDLDPPEFWPYERLKVLKIENEASKNNVLSSLRPMDENPGWAQAESVTYQKNMTDTFWFIFCPIRQNIWDIVWQFLCYKGPFF